LVAKKSKANETLPQGVVPEKDRVTMVRKVLDNGGLGGERRKGIWEAIVGTYRTANQENVVQRGKKLEGPPMDTIKNLFWVRREKY